jgi:hypothetical protein
LGAFFNLGCLGPPPPPCYTLYKYLHIHTGKGRGGIVEPERRGEGQQITKLG